MGGTFRWKLRRCPKDASSEAWEIVESYLDTLAFPGVPLAGTCVDDLDARTHAGVRLVRDEHAVIESVIQTELAERLRREREAARGR